MFVLVRPFSALPAAAALSLALCLAATACRSKERPAAAPTGPNQLETLELRYQGQNSVVSYAELAEDLGYLAPIKLTWVGNTISGPQDIQTVATGDIDFGGAFNGAIIKLVAAKAPIRAVVSYYGIDELTWTGFFVKEDSPIRTPRDFIGKRVAMNTLGAHTEFVLREYLMRGGLTPQEIQQVTMLVVPPINGEQALRQDQLEASAMLGIFRDKALERGGLRLVFSDHDLFGTFSAGSLVFSHKKLREWPNSIRKFVEATGRAIEWARAQPVAVVRQRMAAIITKRGRGEDPSLVQHWKSTGISQPGGRIADSEFQVWIDWLVKDGSLKPGQVSKRDLYTNEFNAYGKAPEARLDP